MAWRLRWASDARLSVDAGIIIGISSVVSNGGGRRLAGSIMKRSANWVIHASNPPRHRLGQQVTDMERALSLDDIAASDSSRLLGVSPIVSSMTTAVRRGFDSSIILSGVSADYFSLQDPFSARQRLYPPRCRRSGAGTGAG